jgi:TPP-dependent indolepyruvate ferredoxin oxidoreductase alpha subunit
MRVQHLLDVAVLTALLPGMVWGQSVVNAGSADFDIDRAMVAEGTSYEPFVVEETRPLREALREGIVQNQSRVIVMDHGKGQLALVVDQMAYHHAAQGEIMGEPWMVSF